MYVEPHGRRERKQNISRLSSLKTRVPRADDASLILASLGCNQRRIPDFLASLEIEREMRAADQPEVRFLTVHGAAEERLAPPARDLARHILLPDHVAVVRIQCPDQPLLLRRDDDVASVSSRCQ